MPYGDGVRRERFGSIQVLAWPARSGAECACEPRLDSLNAARRFLSPSAASASWLLASGRQIETALAISLISEVKDMVVGEADSPWLSFRQLAADQEAALEIFEDRLRRDIERRRGALDRVGSVRPARRIGVGPIDLDGREPPPLAQKPDILALEETAAGADEAFPIQRRGNLLVHFAGLVEFADSPPQGFEVVIVVVDALKGRS